MTTTTNTPVDTTEEEFIDQIWNLAGGEDAYRTMLTWVHYTLSSEEILDYDTQMDSDDPEVVKAAALALFIKYKAACDLDPNLEADMAARRTMRARENQYSDEVVDIFKFIQEQPLDAKDCLQMARVLTSMAAGRYEEQIKENLEDEESSKWMTKYLTGNFTLTTTAKDLLWTAQLPHEYLAGMEEEEEEGE